MISSLIPSDEFARQVPYEELATLANGSEADELVACSVMMDAPIASSGPHDEATAAALRELTLLVRRNLRGNDVVAVTGEELVLMLHGTPNQCATVGERLLAAVRSHLFTFGATGAHRLTLSLGLAAIDRRSGLASAIAAARQAREAAVPDSAARADAPVPATLDLSRFVGRAESLAQLTLSIDDMVRGVGRVVAVIGEPGVGASALLRTMASEIRLRGGSLVTGRCRRPALPAPYALWGDVLRAVRRLPVKSMRLWRDLPSLDPTLEQQNTEATRGGSKTRLLEELADFLRLAAQQRPLILLLEDMQWVDAASWDALEYLITQLESERILIAVTFQNGADDDALERWRHLAMRPRHHEIRLTHLTRDDVKRWLEGAMRLEEVGRDLLAYIYRHSGGNPLLLIHLMRDLEESGHVVSEPGGWRWSAIDKLPSLVSLSDVIGRRIDRLPPAARSVLETAAVLGRDSSASLLFDAAANPDEARTGIETLLAAGMLVLTCDRERSSYAVSHDEIARIAQSRLIPERAAEVHARVADALAANDRYSASEIAGHYELAGDRLRAHQFALRAADQALALHETVAIAVLLAAAERTAPDPVALAEVRVRMASLAEVAGRYEEAESLCDQALGWYEAQGDLAPALTVKRTRSLVRMKRGQPASETLAELLALESEASAAGADMERAAVLLLIAQMHWRLGDLRAAQRVAEEAVGIAENGDDPVLLSDACNRFAVTIQLENAPRARALFDRALHIATTLGDAFRRVRGLNNIGVLELIRNDWDESRRVLTIAVEQARTAGIIESWGRAELNLGVLAGRVGDYEGAARAFSEALRLTSMVQNSEEQLYATYNLAHLERENDKLREAADTYELVVELADRIGQVPIQAGALAGVGLCRFDLGDFDSARAALRKAMTLSEKVVEWFQGRELIEALRLHLMIKDGEMTGAVELLESSLGLADASDVSGAAWLIAEFGLAIRPHAPELVRHSVERYGAHPDVIANPKIRDRFAVLKSDS